MCAIYVSKCVQNASIGQGGQARQVTSLSRKRQTGTEVQRLKLRAKSRKPRQEGVCVSIGGERRSVLEAFYDRRKTAKKSPVPLVAVFG